MRIFIAVLVMIFGLQSWTKADDIGDFEIEGISIGDSALDFVNKKFIAEQFNWRISIICFMSSTGAYLKTLQIIPRSI